MKFDFIFLGGTGQQGRICVNDLLESGYSVLIAGRDGRKIKKLLKNKKTGFIKIDLKNSEETFRAIKKSGADIVVNCAELIYNVKIMKACLRVGKSCTDLGGLQKTTLEQFKLDRNFKKAKITNITGCGSTPGISNIMTAYAIKHFDLLKDITLGFAWDSNIKKFVVPYSIQSIFYELKEPPIALHSGKFNEESKVRCLGTFNFVGVGKQTVYCTVHSEVYTFWRYFKKKGLKNIHYMAGFPEHSILRIRALMELGFDSEGKIMINGKEIIPLKFTIEVLKNLSIPKGYKEVEDLWVKISGMKNGRKKKIKMDCIIKTIIGWEDAGSNIGTGMSISIISQMLKEGLIEEKGVFAPEAVVPPEEFFKELRKRGMTVLENKKRIN